MKRLATRYAVLVLLATLLVTFGCSKGNPSGSSASDSSSVEPTDTGVPPSNSFPGVSSSDAAGIRVAIQNHLQSNQGIKMGAMEMSIDSITINGDHAQARTSFHIKNGNTGMIMNYSLQRQGDGWVVTNGQPADGNTTLPPANSAQGGANQGNSFMPDVNAFFKRHPAPKSN